METATPIVGLLTPFGTPYIFDLAFKNIQEGQLPFIVVKNKEAALAYANTFGKIYKDLDIGTADFLDIGYEGSSQIVFVTEKFLLEYLFEHFRTDIPTAIDFCDTLYYEM